MPQAPRRQVEEQGLDIDAPAADGRTCNDQARHDIIESRVIGELEADIPQKVVACPVPLQVVDLFEVVDIDYQQHWLSLLETPIDCSLSQNALQDRDQRHRLALYNEDNDMLWALLKNLIGEDSRDLILSLLRGELRP